MGVMDGKVALVTGAGRGVGRGVALDLANAGAAVVVNDLGVTLGGEAAEASPAQEVADEIIAAGGRAVANRDSVASWDGAQSMVRAAIDAFGRIDAVVNNAGNLRDSLFHKMTEEEFDAVVAVHLKGGFNVSRAAAPYFKGQASGAYVHMTSTSGLVGNFGQANYAAAKLGIVGLSKSIALDMQRFNVRSNAVAPFAWTRMIELDPGEHPRTATARRRFEETRAREDRAVRHGAAQRRRRACHRADFRRAQQRDLPLLAAEADPRGSYVGRLDRAERGRARLSDVRERLLPAASLGRRVRVESRLTPCRSSPSDC